MYKIAILLIGLYQKYISPHKGYVCAHRYYTGGDSCSQYIKKYINENGIIKTVPIFFERLDECKKIYNEHSNKKDEKNCSDKLYSFIHGKDCQNTCSVCNSLGACGACSVF